MRFFDVKTMLKQYFHYTAVISSISDLNGENLARPVLDFKGEEKKFLHSAQLSGEEWDKVVSPMPGQ
jgi:hypothetical protein